MGTTIRKPHCFSRSMNFLAAGALCFSSVAPLGAAPVKLEKEEPPVKVATNNAALALQNAFIDVAASVSPAVVNISSEWTENVQAYNGYGNMDDFFNFFYGPQGAPRRMPQMKRKQKSLGSGFLITADGYIMTNAHVIGKAEKVTVTFENGVTYPAKIIGKDEKIDIGIIKIAGGAKKFAHLPLGDSDNIKVGQWSIAVGNPFALDHTVTTGVISAKDRSMENGFQSYIQTDASINPGNSGGPLCNIQGEVIGINSAIYTQSGGSVGIGFAIPANVARKVAEDLINEGKVVRAGLGVSVQPLTAKMAKSFGLASTEGALLSDINAGSAAEKAGLKPGDVVLAVNNTHVNGSADLVSKLYTHKAGETVQLTISRNGNESVVPVTLQAMDEKNPAPQRPAEQDSDNVIQASSDRLGFTCVEQTPDIKGQLPPNAPAGPVVSQVEPQSPAAMAGFQPGDVILKVGNTAIVSGKQFAALLKKSDLKTGVRIFLWRGGTTHYAFLQTGDE